MNQPVTPEGKWVPFAPGCEMNVTKDLPGVRLALWWDGEQYVRATDLKPGLGYFLIPTDPYAKLKTPSCRTNPFEAMGISIQFHRGWNFIGDPISAPLHTDSIMKYSKNKIAPVLFGAFGVRYYSSINTYLSSGEAMWFYSNEDFVIPLKNATLASPGFGIVLRPEDDISFHGPQRISPDKKSALKVAADYYGYDYIGINDSYFYSEFVVDNGEFDWSVDDESLATINAQGIIEGLALGHVVVTAVHRETNHKVKGTIYIGCESDKYACYLKHKAQ